MSDPSKNPFEPFFEEIRRIMHDEIAAAIKGNAPKLLYDTKEAARLCNVPAPWLAKAARANLIKCRRLGRYIRFAPEDLEDLVEKGGLTNGIPGVYKEKGQGEIEDDGSGTKTAQKAARDDTSPIGSVNRNAKKLNRPHGKGRAADPEDH